MGSSEFVDIKELITTVAREGDQSELGWYEADLGNNLSLGKGRYDFVARRILTNSDRALISEHPEEIRTETTDFGIQDSGAIKLRTEVRAQHYHITSSALYTWAYNGPTQVIKVTIRPTSLPVAVFARSEFQPGYSAFEATADLAKVNVPIESIVGEEIANRKFELVGGDLLRLTLEENKLSLLQQNRSSDLDGPIVVSVHNIRDTHTIWMSLGIANFVDQEKLEEILIDNKPIITYMGTSVRIVE